MSVDLAIRAVACKSWRWMPGMLTLRHGRVCGSGFLVIEDADVLGSPFVDCVGTLYDWPGCLPDLSDAATLGCLLTLVREAYEPRRAPGMCPMVCTYQSRDKKWGAGAWLYVRAWRKQMAQTTLQALVLPTYETEADALVAALEAAP